MTTPEITPEMRAAALENPNSWLYVIDPALDPDADVPPWGVVGAFPVNERGEIVGSRSRAARFRYRHQAPGATSQEKLTVRWMLWEPLHTPAHQR